MKTLWSLQGTEGRKWISIITTRKDTLFPLSAVVGKLCTFVVKMFIFPYFECLNWASLQNGRPQHDLCSEVLLYCTHTCTPLEPSFLMYYIILCNVSVISHAMVINLFSDKIAVLYVGQKVIVIRTMLYTQHVLTQ